MNLVGRPKKEFRFYSPDGDLVIVDGLAELCEKYDLNQSRMSAVHNGKANQHKGWKSGRTRNEMMLEHEYLIKVNSSIELWIANTSKARGISADDLIREIFRDARIKERNRVRNDG